MNAESSPSTPTTSRRTLLRGAAVTGALVWTAPTVQTLTALPAWAGTKPPRCGQDTEPPGPVTAAELSIRLVTLIVGTTTLRYLELRYTGVKDGVNARLTATGTNDVLDVFLPSPASPPAPTTPGLPLAPDPSAIYVDISAQTGSKSYTLTSLSSGAQTQRVVGPNPTTDGVLTQRPSAGQTCPLRVV